MYYITHKSAEMEKKADNWKRIEICHQFKTAVHRAVCVCVCVCVCVFVCVGLCLLFFRFHHKKKVTLAEVRLVFISHQAIGGEVSLPHHFLFLNFSLRENVRLKKKVHSTERTTRHHYLYVFSFLVAFKYLCRL